MQALRPFQHRFVTRATARGIDTAALSIPRGNGKSWLGGYLSTRVMTPGDPLFVPDSEPVMLAASLDQARIVFRFARAELEQTGDYVFTDSWNRLGIRHKHSNTALKVLSSNAKTALGLVNCPLLIADEPGAWETAGGTAMYDAIETAKGKPESPLRVIYIGTLAPSTAGWWHDLVDDGSHGSTYVQALQGDPDKWDSHHEIRRCNPLMWLYRESRRVLLAERDAARADTRLKARFLSYRLNIPTGDEATMLLNVSDWLAVEARELAPREGRPLVGIDLGAGRAWSAAVALWETGRLEAVALAPGMPDLDAQEKRDRVPGGTYRRLVASGRLMVDQGRRVQRVRPLVDWIRENWGSPRGVVADRFQVERLRDAGLAVEPRVVRWSEATADIRALRRQALDGPLSCSPESRDLIAASLAVAKVRNDDAGNTRLVKRGTNNTARDDVAAALVLVAGMMDRWRRRQSRRPRRLSHGVA